MADKVKSLKLADIAIDPDIQPRAKGTDPDVVEEYAAAALAGAEFPPLVVYEGGGRFILSEGFTRAAAYQKAKVAKVACEVRKGDRRAAVLNACGSNLTHGQRRTNADKRRAVELALKECPTWSNRKIADVTGVSDPFVADIRGGQVLTVSTSTREGKDGKQYPAAAPQVATVATSTDETPEENAVSSSKTETDPGAEFVATVETLCRDADQIAARMKALKQSRFAYSVHVDSAVAQVEAARKTLWQGRPAHPCPYCAANDAPGCKVCNGTGRVKTSTRDAGLAAVGGAK